MKNSNNNTYMFKGNETIRCVNDTSFLFGKFVSAELEKIGMRASYRHVMKPLMENDGLTQLDLVKITKLKAPTISITLRNMEREGIVRREKNDNDRRETHVFITDKGREMHAKVLEAFDKAEEAMLEGISDKELKSVGKLMEKMTDNLKRGLGGDFID
ncbi:MAG: MarR family winged helix-turn-helix transcriptional regulator [Oscillospiraceae bacterium]